MSLYYNKKLISGVRDVPSMTLAQYNALTNKPKLWIRTDAPDSDRGINAEDIEYSSGVSVKDKIQGSIGNLKFEASTASFVFSNSDTSAFTPITDFTNIPSNKIKWINLFGTGGQLIFYSDSQLFNFGAKILSGAFTGTINAKVLIVYTD